jgi:hypothetical protein
MSLAACATPSASSSAPCPRLPAFPQPTRDAAADELNYLARTYPTPPVLPDVIADYLVLRAQVLACEAE